jgi:lipopolysaccharide transport system ATP-binding protein
MSTVIKVENISKQYRLGNVGSGSLKDDLTRWWYRMRGKEDPLLQIGDTNDRTAKGDSDYVWALKDINFEVQQGDVLGIIGRNGAGKSTLLKILSKTTAPTTGSVKVKGRIASLLEVGTGFHPELTGRENIYLNGAILGMRKHEITRKLDEIIDFAGVERYIDTPVKRYSSGMYVRLAFGVAAHLESEILIIDEVLAVGDAEFQKKCLGKMSDVSKGEGRTVLFVSHNLAAVKALCKNALYIGNGCVIKLADTNIVVSEYLSKSVDIRSSYFQFEKTPNSNIEVLSVELFQNELASQLYIEQDLFIKVKFQLNIDHDSVSTSIHLNSEGMKVFCAGENSSKLQKGAYEVIYKVEKNLLNNKNYSIDLFFIFNTNEVEKAFQNIVYFTMNEDDKRTDYLGEIEGLIRPKINIIREKL